MQPETRVADPFGWAGTTLEGKYRVDRIVGEGGFGLVYRGHHLTLDEPIAIKCFKLPILGDARRARFLEAFVAEGRILRQLSKATASVVQALDAGAADSPTGHWTPFIVLEWLEGRTLDDELAARVKEGKGPFALDAAIDFLAPAAMALGVAHSMRIAHRDVKPANLYVTTIGDMRTLKVLDFGIAKVMSDAAGIGAVPGASVQAFLPMFAGPEQLNRNLGASGPWTDVYALARVLVEMLTLGTRPDARSADLYGQAVGPARPTPRSCGVVTSDAVESVFQRALAVDPRNRYQEMRAFWTALTEAAQGRAAPTKAQEPTRTEPMGAAPAPLPLRPRRWRLIAFGAIGALTSSVVVLVATHRGDDDTPERPKTTTKASVGCAKGLADCNGLTADGCEADLQVDSRNCGACGNRCTTGVHETARCVGGGCVRACETGWSRCGKAVDACETSILTDSKNCGACGVDCLGGACVVGRCKPATIASGQKCPSGLAVTKKAAYWTNEAWDGEDGSLGGYFLANGAVFNRPAGPGRHPHSVVVDDADRLIWVDYSSKGGIFRSSTTGLLQLYHDVFPTRVAMFHNRELYWTNQAGNLYRGDVDRSPPTMLVNGGRYGPAARLLLVEEPNPIPLSVYWAMRGTAPASGAIGWVSSAAVGKPFWRVTGQSGPVGLAQSSSFIFWTNETGGAIARIPKGVGSETTVVSGQAGPVGIAVYDDRIYWTTVGDGQIKSAKLDGTDPRTVATGQAAPYAVVVEGTRVWWVNHGSCEHKIANGSVMALELGAKL